MSTILKTACASSTNIIYDSSLQGEQVKQVWEMKQKKYDGKSVNRKVLEEGYLLIQKDCSHKCLGPSFERRLTFDVVLEDCSVVILTWVDCQSCWGICFTTGVTSNDFNFASINIPALGNIKVPHTIIYQLVFASLKLKNKIKELFRDGLVFLIRILHW